MLIETNTALYNHLYSINEDKLVSELCKVNVLTSEKYRENIALSEKNKELKLNYPIIVIYDGNIEYDRKRFYNDFYSSDSYSDVNRKGETVIKKDVYLPLMPYNLNYRIEIICRQRIQLDSILLWIMKNVPERGCLDVPYNDENNKVCVYNSQLNRGPIIKADESTSSVLYRRTFELRLTTLIPDNIKESVVVAESLRLEEKAMKGETI